MRRQTRRHRRGFVLLTVLTVVTGCVAIGAVAVSSTRLSLKETQNRMAFIRAVWLAEECAERARAALYEASTETPSTVSAWSQFDQVIRALAPQFERRRCAVSLVAAGDRLDLTKASVDLLRSAFQFAGTGSARADSLIDALLDWQDADTITRRLGAEQGWYQIESRVAPRNGPIAAMEEVRLIRGFETASPIDAWFDVEGGRLSLTHTPREVLAVVPGIGPEIAEAIEERRKRGALTRTLSELFGEISAASRTSYLDYQEALVAQVTVEPDAWILTSRSSTVGSPVVAVLELKLARSGSSTSVVRRRARWA